MGTSMLTELSAIREVCEVTIRTELRETLDKELQLLMYVGLLAVGGIVLFGAGNEPGAYQYGAATRTRTDLPVRRIIRELVVSVWVFGVLLFSFLSATDQESVDREFLAVNASRPTFIVGRALARFLKHGDWIVLFTLVGSVLFALGARSIAAFVTLSVGTSFAFFCASVLGSVLGRTLGYVNENLGRKQLRRYVVAAVAVLGYVGFFLERDSFVSYALESPVGWYADLASVGVPGSAPHLLHAGLIVTGSIAGLPVLIAVEHRLMTANWRADPPRRSNGDRTTIMESADSPSFTRFHRSLRRFWSLAVRRPRSSAFLAAGPVLGYALFEDVLFRYPEGVGIALVLALALTAGTGPVLNLIGNEADVLGQYLLVPGGERVVIRSYVVGTLVALAPLALVVVGSVAYFTVVGWWSIGAGIALFVAAPFVSLVSGLLFPGYSKTATGTRSNHIPHVFALLFSVGALGTIALPFAVGAVHPASIVRFLRFVPEGSATEVGAVMTIVTSLLAANTCYRLSVETLRDRYVRSVLE